MALLFEHTEVFGIEAALRGMRNPMNSWDRSDSGASSNSLIFSIGQADLDLAKRLFKAGQPHRKYLRQIFLTVDISAPRYWWQEFDTYKVGTTANSCSTMHKLYHKEFTLDDFEIGETDDEEIKNTIISICKVLNKYREKYLETKDFNLIRQMKKILPESYIQKRTVSMNFEVLLNMVEWRKTHRLPEWRIDFMNWVKTVPFFSQIVDF